MKLFKVERVRNTGTRWNRQKQVRQTVIAEGDAELWINESALLQELGKRAVMNVNGRAVLARGLIEVRIKDRFKRVETLED